MATDATESRTAFQQNNNEHMTSRHKRPPKPQPFQMTTRDLDVLASVYRHRFLTAAHVHGLHFQTASLRVAQVRLQRLWSARFLDRMYIAPETPDVRDRFASQPLYSLALAGARRVAAAQGVPLSQIPHTKSQNRRGFARLRHNLVFTDLAAAFETLAAREPEWRVTVTREDILRRALPHWKGRPSAIVPDGAITLSHPTLPKPQTILVEVVRAGVRAGNRTVQRKLFRYRAALQAGFFREVHGFEWVRTVVFLTPSMARAKNLAVLARDIPGGERLLRFGAYETRASNRLAPTTLLTPERLAESVLLTPTGQLAPFLPPPSNPSTPSHV